MASGSLKSFYRQKKNRGLSKPRLYPSISSKKKASPSFAEALGSDVKDDQEKHEEVLRQFDLNTRFGPCVGMSRLDRWERAKKWGMSPPGDIESLLKIGEVGADCVFDGRI